MAEGPDEAPSTQVTGRPASPQAYDALAEAKLLLRTIRSGALATVSLELAPFVSLVSTATLPDGRPVMLLSRLATHTQQLDSDSRCSLLLSRGGKGDPLAHPRITLTGTARRVENDPLLAARSRFLRRQPKAALYADFPDFGFFVLDIAAVHLNGGFARAARFSGEEILTDLASADALIDSETDAIEHMNIDHRDALALYASVTCRAGDGHWTTTGVDPEGLDLACGDRVARLVFDQRVTNPAELRRMLKQHADNARNAAAAVG